LEKSNATGAISNDPDNHHLMVQQRAEKVARIADSLPPLKVEGNQDADLLIVGFGGTYGHLHDAMQQMNNEGKKVALAHFNVINPLPRGTQETLARYKKVVVAEQNMGQLAAYLRMKTNGIDIRQYNEVKGQPFNVSTLVDAFTKIMEE
ncbi:MAG: 2-oxoacid:acceptor oxidoreductase subunit alpha, partial [Bacteroidaceae bacterium]|nr:2-oxoacid:acceptor oxidoreductase subunit alpha [Bacteroidaceae bacterium]